MSRGPLVTVGMPVHRVAPDFLDRAVESILAQTFTDFELLVVDDGAADPILRERLAIWERRDRRVRVFRRDHQGLAPSLNFLVHQARGAYFARMDADDIALPLRLQRQVATMEADPRLVLCGTWYELMDELGRTINVIRTVTSHQEIVRKLERKENPVPHPSVMFRTDVVARLGGYDQRFGRAGGSEDFELWTRLVDAGRLRIIPEVLLRYRLTLQSISHLGAEENLRLHWLAWKTWQLRRQGSRDPYAEAVTSLERWRFYYHRIFRAEALRQQASRLRVLGNASAARRLLLRAWVAAPWRPVYPALLMASYFRSVRAVMPSQW